jgi:hypothetical protein
MAKGMALAIGLNAVDPDHYSGWSGELNACEADAEDMTNIGTSKGFQVTTLMTKDATRANVLDALSKAANELVAGDIFLLSYSGHGGQLPDLNGDEIDAADETWCLYDGELVDDELYAQMGMFAKGVRILVFSDSCHSGTVTKMAYYSRIRNALSSDGSAQQVRYRFMPSDVALRVYRKNRAFYNKILENPSLKETKDTVKASVLLLSGCQDNQFSSDGVANGLFTSQMLAVWREGAFEGNYRRFYREILKRMPPDQTPNYYRTGVKDAKFEAQTPFTV